jgi:hypothetical protein
MTSGVNGTDANRTEPSRRGDSNPGPLHYEAWAGVGRSGSHAGICGQDGCSRVADPPLMSQSGTVRLPSGFHLIARHGCSGGWLSIASAPVVEGVLDASPHSPEHRRRRQRPSPSEWSFFDRAIPSTPRRSSTPDLGAARSALRRQRDSATLGGRPLKASCGRRWRLAAGSCLERSWLRCGCFGGPPASARRPRRADACGRSRREHGPSESGGVRLVSLRYRCLCDSAGADDSCSWCG